MHECIPANGQADAGNECMMKSIYTWMSIQMVLLFQPIHVAGSTLSMYFICFSLTDHTHTHISTHTHIDIDVGIRMFFAEEFILGTSEGLPEML